VSGDGNITLRPVAGSDDQFLLSVYASTRDQEMAMVPWSAEQKEVFVHAQFTAQGQHYAAEHPHADHDIICKEEVAVGRVYVDRSAQGLHILDITILPQYRRLGIGSTVLRRLMQEASAGAAAKPVTIYIESFNPSQSLFRKLGFEAVSESGFHQLLRWDGNHRS
jgi:ribosomal protein S18 acetylase RimI-like enzyme